MCDPRSGASGAALAMWGWSSRRIRIISEDGTEVEVGPDDAYDIPPGHDAYVVGDEPVVQIERQGLRTFAGSRGGVRGRRLATLLFTDLVDSTSTAAGLGDTAWRDILSRHYQSARNELDRFGGHESKTTGDGILAVFDGPAAALRCAAAISSAATSHNLQIRAGVHVGEVHLVGMAVEGLAVHEAARIMAAAGPQEILASEITRSLLISSGIDLEERGLYSLEGTAWKAPAVRLRARVRVEQPDETARQRRSGPKGTLFERRTVRSVVRADRGSPMKMCCINSCGFPD
jgi:class 3 adenylate cyclase